MYNHCDSKVLALWTYPITRCVVREWAPSVMTNCTTLGRRLAVIREVLKADIQGMRDTLE